MPSKDRKKKVDKKNADDASTVVLAVRANVNACDEASVIMDHHADESSKTNVHSASTAEVDDNVIMKLTFGTTADTAPDAYQSYQTDILPSNPVGSMDCFNLSTAGQDQLYASDPNACSLAPIQDWPMSQMPLPPPQAGTTHLEAPVAPFGSKAAPADASLWNSRATLQGASTRTIAPPTFVPKPNSVVAHAGGVGVKVVRLLAEFEEKGKTGEWPLSTSVHCYWCSHRFDTPPVGLPIKYVAQTGKFQTIGCFCSLQCACAYNFDSNRDSEDECMMRYSLINALSAKLGCGRIVKPAPSRLALSMFGGHMSIEEFRAYGSGNLDTNGGCGGGAQRQIIINCPPMQSVTQQVEDISESDMTSEYRYVPLDNDRVQRYQEKVRLQRTKPLSDMKNTLDRTMKLKYNHVS